MNVVKNGFEILNSDSDIKIRVWGKTTKELFKNALRGVFTYVKPGVLAMSRRGGKILHKVSVRAVDLNSLLVEFLTEAVKQSDMGGNAFVDIAFENFGENFLEGELKGVKVNDFEKDIKAVSYSDVEIKKNPETGFFETTLVCEV